MLFAALLALPIALGVASPVEKHATPFFPPANGGGSMLAGPAGSGEPLNVIISALSSPAVLTGDGILNFARSIGFSTGCLGIHTGDHQTADLGDGEGPWNETNVLCRDHGNAVAGTCPESLQVRYWRQDGPTANTSAVFLAVSQKEDASKDHAIAPNGYDKGRDELVSYATNQTYFNGVAYSTTTEKITGLLRPGSEGINHGIKIDGVVVLLTVTIQ